MIHILLLILKIIGIILLVALALTLLILFWPVLYRVKADAKEKNVSCDVMAHWLFHIVHFRLAYKNDKPVYKLRFLGIPIISSKKQKHNKKNSKANNNIKADNDIKNHNNIKSNNNIKENNGIKADNGINADNIEIETIDGNKKEQTIIDIEKYVEKNDESYDRNDAKLNKDKIINRFVGFLKNLFANLKKIILKIKLFFSDTCNNIKILVKKIEEVKTFILAESTKVAYNYGKKYIVKILRHIFPKKIKGRINFGLKEPHLTGQALGYGAMAMGMFGINPNNIEVIPDFETEKFDGYIKCRGRIFVGVVGLYILKLYLKKEINDVIKKFS